jgi:Tol biopolymer transport system component
MIRGTEAQGRNGRVSPDGEWLAFVSLESGRPQVWVHRFPEPGNRFRVSTDGGVLPRWRQDGRELYFVRPVGQGGGGELMVVTFQERTTTIGFSTPEPLFPLTFFSDSFNDYPYAVSPDGDRFLVLDTSGASFEEALTVVLNWQDSVEP